MKTYLAIMALTTSVILTTFPMTNRLTDYHLDYDQQLLTTLHKLNTMNTLLTHRHIIYATTTEYTKIETCPDRQCHTANGQIPSKDVVTACPRSYAFGTKIIISGITLTCTDRTAPRYDGRFDIFHGSTLSDYQEALKYGKQVKEIIYYDKGYEPR